MVRTEKDSGRIFMGEKRKQERSQRLLLSNNRQIPPPGHSWGGCTGRVRLLLRAIVNCWTLPTSEQPLPQDYSFCEVVFFQILGSFYYFLECLTVPWGMWDWSSLTRDWTHDPCIGRLSLNHRTPGEVSVYKFLCRHTFSFLSIRVELLSRTIAPRLLI